MVAASRELNASGEIQVVQQDSSRTPLPFQPPRPEPEEEFDFELPPRSVGPHRRLLPLGVSSARLEEAIAETGGPASVADRQYYKPSDRGFEHEITRRLEEWRRLKQERRQRD